MIVAVAVADNRIVIQGCSVNNAILKAGQTIELCNGRYNVDGVVYISFSSNKEDSMFNVVIASDTGTSGTNLKSGNITVAAQRLEYITFKNLLDGDVDLTATVSAPATSLYIPDSNTETWTATPTPTLTPSPTNHTDRPFEWNAYTIGLWSIVGVICLFAVVFSVAFVAYTIYEKRLTDGSTSPAYSKF